MFRVVFKRHQKITPQLAKQRRLTRIFAGASVSISILLIGIIIFMQMFPPSTNCFTAQSLPNGQLTCQSGKIAIDGGTTIVPFISSVAHQYASVCPGALISIQGTGDLNGLEKVENGSINIAVSDFLAPSNKTDLVGHPIAAIVYTVIVNSDVGITNLTTSQIKGIYTGKYQNWEELGGLDQKITPLSRGSGSDTRFSFDTYVLGGQELVYQPSPLADTQSMIAAVQKTPGAIGYADLYDVQANPQSITLMKIDGDAPTVSLVQNNSYTFWSIEHMYTKGPATGLEQAFINYAESFNARTLAQNYSLIHISDMKIPSLNAVCSR